MDKQQKNILELIHTSYFQFTAAEQRIADFVLAQYEQVQFMEKIRFFLPKKLILPQRWCQNWRQRKSDIFHLVLKN
jgi:hypothetical protein